MRVWLQIQGVHTFVEIDHEIIPTVILFPSADLLKKSCCQLQAKVCGRKATKTNKQENAHVILGKIGRKKKNVAKNGRN